MSEILFDGMALTVEVGFSTTAGSGTVPLGSTLASITWTDITEHVREVSTSRGRSSELDTYSAGSCQVLLDNRTRLFDPENTAGTYYGKLTPLRPIRIRVTPSGGTIRSIFFGFIEQWPQSYSWPNESTVSVTASDAFKVLNEFKLDPLWKKTLFNLNPIAWFRLSDFNGSQYAFEIEAWTAFSGSWKTTTNTASFCVPGESLIADDPANSSAFDGQKYFEASNFLGDGVSVPREEVWVASLWIQTTENRPGRYAIFNDGNDVHSGHFGLVVDANGIGTIEAAAAGAKVGGLPITASKITSTVKVNDGQPHLVMLNHLPIVGIGYHIYVDDQRFLSTSTYSVDVDASLKFTTIGKPIAKSSTAANNFPSYFIGNCQDLVIYDAAEGLEPDFDNSYKIGIGTYRKGERTDQRITFLADFAGWMTDGLDLNTGDTTLQGVKTTGQGLLDALKEVEATEQGRLFMSVDGKIRFIDRNAEGSGNFVTSQATFSDNPGVGEIKYSDIVLTYDDRYIFNEITVTQPNGTFYTQFDSTSQGKYFKRTLNIDNFIGDDGYYTANTAIYKIQQYKDPKMRIDQFSVNARRAVAYQSPCVTLDIGDRITVERTPQDVGAQIVKTLIVEGVKHSITRDNWVVTFNTSPTLENAPFVLDSATLGVLDTDILAY
jgi:hypothetical protein